jgi:glycosyltransferase involved in cell wall biosynthesis
MTAIKMTLGMICKNEQHYLSLTLPLIRNCFDDFVAVDAESTDKTVEVLKENGARVFTRTWTNHYADAKNAVISKVDSGWIFILDSDEAMFPEDINKVRERISLLEGNVLVQLSRIEFVQDHNHYDDKCYPDYQGRVFRAGQNYEYRNKVHELVYRKGETRCEWELKRYVDYGDCPLYHYGQCKPREVVWLRHHNYGFLQRGEKPLLKPPENLVLAPYTHLKLFTGNHPLKGRTTIL